MKFDDYATKYSQVKMERRDGILQLTLHSSNAEFKWSARPHEDISYAFYDVARDHENLCVILTGTGNVFCAEMDHGGGPGGLQVTEEHAPPQPAGVPPTWYNPVGKMRSILKFRVFRSEHDVAKHGEFRMDQGRSVNRRDHRYFDTQKVSQ